MKKKELLNIIRIGLFFTGTGKKEEQEERKIISFFWSEDTEKNSNLKFKNIITAIKDLNPLDKQEVLKEIDRYWDNIEKQYILYPIEYNSAMINVINFIFYLGKYNIFNETYIKQKIKKSIIENNKKRKEINNMYINKLLTMAIDD